jgi:hypothetical protein
MVVNKLLLLYLYLGALRPKWMPQALKASAAGGIAPEVHADPSSVTSHFQLPFTQVKWATPTEKWMGQSCILFCSFDLKHADRHAVNIPVWGHTRNTSWALSTHIAFEAIARRPEVVVLRGSEHSDQRILGRKSRTGFTNPLHFSVGVAHFTRERRGCKGRGCEAVISGTIPFLEERVESTTQRKSTLFYIYIRYIYILYAPTPCKSELAYWFTLLLSDINLP